MNSEFTSRLDVQAVHLSFEKFKNEISKWIYGQDELIELLMIALLSNGHILIEGLPGTAKTLISRIMAKSISVDFGRIQFTPDLMPSDVIGTSVYNFKSSEFEFKQGPIFSNIVLIDEINRAPAKTQSSLFEVMEERQITHDGTSYPLDPPFMVIATQNPIEHEGTYALPEAQLDRFLFKVYSTYPSLTEEINILKETSMFDAKSKSEQIQAVISGVELEGMKKLIHLVHVEEKLLEFLVKLVQKTRNDVDVLVGASTRASLALLTSTKAIAALKGRDYVIPDDIIYMAKPVLRHRLILQVEKELEGSDTDQVIDKIISSIDIPR